MILHQSYSGRRGWRLWLLSISLLFVLGGCESLRELTAGATNWRTVEEKALNTRLDFHDATFSGKARLHLPAMGINNLSASYRMNIVNDSLILIRVIKLIEAARIQITPDSIYVMDRINEQVITCDYRLAEELTGLPADFALLQDLLLGQYHPVPANMTVSEKRGTPKTFVGMAAGKSFAYDLDAGLFRPLQIRAVNPETQERLTLTYDDFADGPGASYPQAIDIEVMGEEEMAVTFNHRKVAFDNDPNLLDFDIPSTYLRKSCRDY